MMKFKILPPVEFKVQHITSCWQCRYQTVTHRYQEPATFRCLKANRPIVITSLMREFPPWCPLEELEVLPATPPEPVGDEQSVEKKFVEFTGSGVAVGGGMDAAIRAEADKYLAGTVNVGEGPEIIGPPSSEEKTLYNIFAPDEKDKSSDDRPMLFGEDDQGPGGGSWEGGITFNAGGGPIEPSSVKTKADLLAEEEKNKQFWMHASEAGTMMQEKLLSTTSSEPVQHISLEDVHKAYSEAKQAGRDLPSRITISRETELEIIGATSSSMSEAPAAGLSGSLFGIPYEVSTLLKPGQIIPIGKFLSFIEQDEAQQAILRAQWDSWRRDRWEPQDSNVQRITYSTQVEKLPAESASGTMLDVGQAFKQEEDKNG